MGRFSEDEDLRENIILQKDGFEDCCGICIIHDFENYPDATVKASRQSALDELRRLTSRTSGQALALVALAEFQISAWSGILEDAGFQMTSKGLNRGTGNAIFLFTKTLNPTSKPYKVIKPKPKLKPKTKSRKA